ncbi:hypothetical protein GGI25_006168 [Coemansia spiralis]|uniref:Mitochondrial protein n=2 Tax=Coemansia TaxID=4863 RepID=A0A9W8G1G3_9FUNG|nr:hypothetical protein EDC05_006073 [Coemansia umbellata]KAJ2669368.1 hypothetical protein GGI25_006168 [Coemansia spiralis]
MRRCLHTTRVISNDKKGRASWPTAESVILQRISSNGQRARTGKELVVSKQVDTKGTDSEQPSSKEPKGSVQSVSVIINSVREARAASQKPHKAAQSKTPEQSPPYCLFNTHKLVSRLVDSGYDRAQATALMTLLKHKIHIAMAHVQANMLTKSDLENDAYLFRAALQELRTETQMIRKNDQAILESQLASIDREIESLLQRTNDEIGNVRSDIEIEMNNHKHDTSHAMKSFDMRLFELSSKYQFVLGEMKTDVEAVRLESIRRGLLAAVVTTLVLVGIVWAPELVKRLKDRDYVMGDALETKQMHAAIVGDDVEAQPGRLETNMESQRPSTAPTHTTPPSRAPTRYRDHSHLTINYDPTIFSADSQPGSRPVARGEDMDNYDDWFDSFHSQDDGRRSSSKSASLMDSDSKLDSTFWRQDTHAEPSGGKPKEREEEEVEPVARIPLHFTYEQNRRSKQQKRD